MDAITLLRKYFSQNREACEIVLEHSRMVADKALAIAKALNDPALDLKFVEEAALLHDIGVCRTCAPHIGCFGTAPYICHGVRGKDILEAEGLPRHALVCERHIGVGLTADDIIRQNLPLPLRDMSPTSLEERIVCFADLFFSKKPGSLRREKPVAEIQSGLERFGAHKVRIFDLWQQELHPFNFPCKAPSF